MHVNLISNQFSISMATSNPLRIILQLACNVISPKINQNDTSSHIWWQKWQVSKYKACWPESKANSKGYLNNNWPSTAKCFNSRFYHFSSNRKTENFRIKEHVFNWCHSTLSLYMASLCYQMSSKRTSLLFIHIIINSYCVYGANLHHKNIVSKKLSFTLLLVSDLGWFLQHFKEEIVSFLMLIEYWYVYIDVFWVNLAFIPTFLIEIHICPHKRMEFLILSSCKNRALLKLIRIKKLLSKT